MTMPPPVLLLQLLVVSAIVLVHLAGLRLALRQVEPGPMRRRWMTAGILVLVLLDLPLYHIFGFYKEWHPLALDRVYNAVSIPFMILHANAMIMSIILLLGAAVRLVRGARARRTTSEKHAGQDRLRLEDRLRGNDSVDGLAAQPRSLPPTAPELPARRRLLRTAGFATVGVITSSRTLSAMLTTHDHVVERVVVKIPKLPEGLRGTTIVLLSDLHSSIFMGREEMDVYVRAANDLKPDIALVTGDFVNSKVVEVYPFAEAFASLHAPLGVYGVTGNHDYYTREIETVAREVEQSGIRLLRNANTAIERNGEKLWLMGMDDADIYHVNNYLADGRTERGTIEKMLAGIPDGAPRLFLCHKPYPFEEYARLGCDLMLSGHTHGGQVVLGHLDTVNLSFASLASRYLNGLYLSAVDRRTQMYVTRGIGTVGLPMRLNCPPEITHITLV